MARQSAYEDRLRHLQDEISNKQLLIERLRETLSAHAPPTSASTKDDDYDSLSVTDAQH